MVCKYPVNFIHINDAAFALYGVFMQITVTLCVPCRLYAGHGPPLRKPGCDVLGRAAWTGESASLSRPPKKQDRGFGGG